jgi:farnesyl diphosphate synthase
MRGMPFSDWAAGVQARMEDALQALLPGQDQTPTRLHEAMRYAVTGGGKRVRPLLVFAAGELSGATSTALESAAAAVEMIHAYSLVHDDMPCMDDDALRRGKPTVHVKYDEATALLVGDALQAQAFAVLAEGEGPAGNRLAMVSLLTQAAGSSGMCGGQAIDLFSVGKSLSLAELEQMHLLKTGALLRASVLLGALAGNITLNEGQRAALETYSRAIGLAFQVVDDVLDATTDTATLGKTAGKDAQDNKPTYVSILGLEQSRQLAAQLREEAHRALTPFGDQAVRLRELADLVVQRNA